MLKSSLIYAVYTVCNIVEWLIIINVLSSWLPFLSNNAFFAKLFAIIDTLVEPFMKPARMIMSKSSIDGMPLDFSPIVALLLVKVMQYVLVGLLGML